MVDTPAQRADGASDVQDTCHMPVSGCEPAEKLSQDTACIRCGYNLRGLTTDKLCPECGMPIERSIHGNLLKFADPAWLERLRRGTTLKLWSTFFGILMAGGLLFLSPVARTGPTELLALIWGALGLWATFLITTQEPRTSLQENTGTLRTAIRFCAIVSFVAGSVESTGVASSGGSALAFAIRWLTVVGLVTLIGELLYLRQFALRIISLKLARSTRIVMWGLPGSCLVFAVATKLGLLYVVSAGRVARFAAGQGDGVVFYAGVVSLCVAAVGFVVFGVWFVALLFLYRRAFTNAVAESRRLSADDAPVAHSHE